MDNYRPPSSFPSTDQKKICFLETNHASGGLHCVLCLHFKVTYRLEHSRGSKPGSQQMHIEENRALQGGCYHKPCRGWRAQINEGQDGSLRCVLASTGPTLLTPCHTSSSIPPLPTHSPQNWWTCFVFVIQHPICTASVLADDQCSWNRHSCKSDAT